MKKTNIIITIKKELRSIFRDKKTFAMIIGFPLIISVFIFLYGMVDETSSGETKYSIGINYELNSTEKTLLSELNLETTKYDSLKEMKNAYDNTEIDGYIEYDESKKIYTIYADDNTVTGASILSSTIGYLDSYNKYLGDLYLKGEDIDPEVVYNNLTYEIKNIAGEEASTSAMMLNMIINMAFTYIIAAIAMAAVNMATSAIAVEKENGTLETILTLPVTTNELIIGKYLATTIIGAFSSIIGLFITIISMAIAGNRYEMYEKFVFTPGVIIWSILICILASLLIAAIAIALTSSSKSYKEAQAAGQILSIVCMAPLFLSILNVSTKQVFYLIPILNHTTILMDLCYDKISYFNLFLTIASTALYSVVVLYVLVKKFKSEKVLFGA